MRRCRYGLIGLCIALCASANVFAQNPIVPDAGLKAAYLFHFIQFTDWPAPALAGLRSFAICTHATNPLRAVLADLEGKIVHGLPIAVRTFDTDHYEGCQVVFFNDSEGEAVNGLANALVDSHVLTVLESAQAANGLAIITLSLEERRLVFCIDKKLAQSSGLNISSKLLRLARSVK